MSKSQFDDLLSNDDLKDVKKYILSKTELKKPRELSDEEKERIEFRRKAGWSWFNPTSIAGANLKKRDVVQFIQNPHYRAGFDFLANDGLGALGSLAGGAYMNLLTKAKYTHSDARTLLNPFKSDISSKWYTNPAFLLPVTRLVPSILKYKTNVRKQRLINDIAESYMQNHQEGAVESMDHVLKEMLAKEKRVSELKVRSKKVKQASELPSFPGLENFDFNRLGEIQSTMRKVMHAGDMAMLGLGGLNTAMSLLEYKNNKAEVDNMRERFKRKMKEKAEAEVFLNKVRLPLYRKGQSNDDKIEDFDKMFKVSADTSPMLPHQQRIIERLEKDDQPGLILMHGLGSGKTRSSIEAYKKLGLPTEVLLPAALKGNYEKELKKWVGRVPKNINIRSQQEIARKGANPEDFKDKLMIIDEAHRLRNEDTKLYKTVKELAPKKRILLTGTPIYNHPADIAKLINLAAGKNVMPERQPEFEQEYIAQKTVFPSFVHRVLGVKPGQELSVKNKDYLKAVFKKLVDYHGGNSEGFPDVSHERVKVPMSAKQQDIYKAMMKELPWYMRMKVQAGLPPDKKELDKLIPFLSGARMISNTTKGFVKDDKDVSSPKIEKAFEFLKSKIDEDPSYKGLIYSNYLNSGVDPYKALLQKANIPFGEFTGEIKDSVRNQLVKDYNENKLKALIVSSAGGEGLDLKGTRLVQLLEPHFNNEKIKQVIGRAARYKSHESLDPEKRKVLIQNYLSTVTPGMLDKITGKITGSKNISTDEYLQNLADEKEKLNNEFIKLIKGDEKPAFQKEFEKLNKKGNINPILQTVFGKNAIPRPEEGEGMYDAVQRQNRDITARGIAGEQFSNNPLFQRLGMSGDNKFLKFLGGLGSTARGQVDTLMAPFMGGNVPGAAEHLHKSMQGANTMGNFDRLTGVAPGETRDAIEQAKNQFYKSTPSEADGNAKTSSEKLVGGKADKLPKKLFPKKELNKGVKHELEHTSDKGVASEIAKDHLAERADYYSAMEKAKLGGL